MSRTRPAAMALPLLLAPVLAFAPSLALSATRDCEPRLHEGWVRLPPGKTTMLAGFGRLQNDCAAPAAIVSASSPDFGKVELHRSGTVDGVSRMRPVPRLELAPRGAVAMAPGGLHLMLMHPRADLRDGDRVVVDFELADGRIARAEFSVRALVVPAR